MLIQVALIISVVLQFGAFFITISMIQKTRFNIAWISISLGFMLMAFRRVSDLMLIFENDANSIQTHISSWIAVVISISMFVASFYLRKIFMLLNKFKKIRKENEAHLLSAIISTEEKERKYFAKELHDGLGPILSSMKMTLSAIDKSTIGDANTEILGKAEFAVDHAIVATQEISNHLNPQVLERFGIEKAIKAFASNTLINGCFELEINCNLGKTRYNFNVELILYRIACELINNTIKHAAATKARVLLMAYQQKIDFMYEDNGVGFNTDALSSAGMGLTNIHSRVKSLNGHISIDSKPDNGMFVKIELPI